MKLSMYRRFERRELLVMIKTYLFRSSLNLSTLFLWGLHHSHMRLICFFKQGCFNDDLKVPQFKKRGFAILGKVNSNLSECTTHINELFLKEPTKKYMDLPKTADPIISSFVFNALTDFSGHIQSVLHSHFQTYWIQIYKTSPGENESSSSFAWHQDADPPSMHKIFIYMNDVTSRNGAFRTFDRQISKKLFKNGFISNNPENRIKSQKLITKELLCFSNWIEGPAGTISIFDNNLIHRGTYPEEGFRIVISIEKYPSNKQIDFANVQNSLSMPVTDDFPNNPYVNKYLN